jgi:hypothetical protein
MTKLVYPAGHSYDPPGQCIYCRDKSNPEILTREHIMPFALNGTLVIPKASCPKCSEITSKVETFCLQKMFIDARTHLGLASRSERRKKKPRPSLRVGHIGPSNEIEWWQELTAGKHPFALLSFEFGPAGILSRQPPNSTPSIQMCFTPAPGFAERFGQLAPNASTRYIVDTDLFARMLAKIAHSFAVGNLGITAFDPFLTGVILGSDRDIFRYVGGAGGGSEKNPNLHSIRLNVENGMVVVYIRLFAALDAPAYLIAVGRKL